MRDTYAMAAMKPRTGDGPMEVTKEARSLVMRIPLEGGGRLVVELNPQEANNLSAAHRGTDYVGGVGNLGLHHNIARAKTHH